MKGPILESASYGFQKQKFGMQKPRHVDKELILSVKLFTDVCKVMGEGFFVSQSY